MTCLIYLSPLPWSSFAQRPHKFVEWFHARTGGQVLWIDPYPTRLPTLDDFRRIKAAMGVVPSPVSMPVPEWLTVLQPRALPIEPLPGSVLINRLLWTQIRREIDGFSQRSGCLLVIGKPSKMAVDILRSHPQLPSLFDAMDDFPAFYRGFSKWAMGPVEHEVAQLSKQITVSSTLLANRFSECGARVRMALNACAIEVLPSIDAPHVRSAPHVLGYVGTIAQWFDWEMVTALALANPQMHVRLIGPVFGAIPSGLPGNIEQLPACSHQQAIDQMRQFSVGLIPFKRTLLTDSVDPIKYYEYRALGLPVLSTPFGEMAMRGGATGVFLADGQANLARVVVSALAHQDDAAQIAQFRSENSWSARFDSANIL